METITLKQIAQTYWPVLACSFGIAVLATPICRAVAHRLGIVDKPDDWLKPHQKPVAYLGGVAIYFAWMGGLKKGLGHPHYYRVHGKTFLIEFDNIQNNANHVHSVWRDYESDFGRDWIAEHYQQDH